MENPSFKSFKSLSLKGRTTHANPCTSSSTNHMVFIFNIFKFFTDPVKSRLLQNGIHSISSRCWVNGNGFNIQAKMPILYYYEFGPILAWI